MKELEKKKKSKVRVLFKRCHRCYFLMETSKEPERCEKCSKAFLPLGYHKKKSEFNINDSFSDYFSSIDDIYEEDLIKGIYVLW